MIRMHSGFIETIIVSNLDYEVRLEKNPSLTVFI